MGAESDQTLKLLIQLGVIGQADAQAAKQLLNEVKDSADPSAESFSNLGKQATHAAEGMKEVGLHGHEVHRLMGEINRLAPGMGELLRGAMNPEMMGIAAAIVAFEAIHSIIKSISEEAQELKKHLADMATAAIEFQESLDADNITAAADAIKTYGENVNEAALALEHQKGAEDAIKAVMDEKAKQQQDLHDAVEKAALAKIDAAHLNPQEKERKNKEVQDYYAGLKKETGDEAEANKLKEEGADITRRQQNTPYMQGMAGEAAASANMLRAAADQAASDLKRIKDQSDIANKGVAGVMSNPDASPEERAHAQRAFESNEEIVRKATEASAKAERDAKAAETIATQRANAVQANIEAIDRETAAFHQSAAVLEARIKGQETVARFQGQDGLAKALDTLFDRVEALEKTKGPSNYNY